MRELLATPIGAPRAANQVTAPRVLVQFWDDARAVPGDVQACLVADALEAAGEAERILYVNDNPIIAGPGHPVIAGGGLVEGALRLSRRRR